MTKAKAHTVGTAGHLVTTALPSEWGGRGLTWGRPVPPSQRGTEGALGAGAQGCVCVWVRGCGYRGEGAQRFRGV